MKKLLLILIFCILFINFVIAKDVSVFQGQYFIDDKFQVGTYGFEFNVYDDETSGDLIYSDKENITLGNWGQWKVELAGLSEAANNVSKDYFMEVIIDGIPQFPRKRITQFNFLRKDVDEVTQGRISAGSFIISNNDKIDQGFFVDAEKNYSTTINAKLNVTDDAFFKNLSINNKNVCLEDGTNCQIINNSNLNVNSSVFWNGLSNVRGILGSLIINDMGWIDNTVNNLVNYYTKSEIDLKLSQKLDASDSISNTVNNLINYYTKSEIDLKLSQKQNTSNSISSSSINENKIPVSFISTTSGDLKKNVVYLPLGTSGQISTQVSDSSWIIDKDLVITGILWNANINSRINPSRIILMKSVTSKNLFFDTDLNVNLQGYSKGSNFNFNVSFNQGDLALIKYEPTGGANERINDISITLVGYYK